MFWANCSFKEVLQLQKLPRFRGGILLFVPLSQNQKWINAWQLAVDRSCVKQQHEANLAHFFLAAVGSNNKIMIPSRNCATEEGTLGGVRGRLLQDLSEGRPAIPDFKTSSSSVHTTSSSCLSVSDEGSLLFCSSSDAFVTLICDATLQT